MDAGDDADYNAYVVQQDVNLTHHFLIAMPAMVDPNFARTLTYICEHNEQGALGIVTEADLFRLVEQAGWGPAPA